MFDNDILVCTKMTEENHSHAYKHLLSEKAARNIDFKTHIGLGVRVESQYIYGMAARETEFVI